MRMTIGVMAVLVRMIVQFIKKYLYVAVFIYVPYLFMAQFNPLIRDHKESAVLFMFFMLSTICGSLANNTLLAKMCIRDSSSMPKKLSGTSFGRSVRPLG